MSKIKNGGLDQYGAGPFEQQQFGTAAVQDVNVNSKDVKRMLVSLWKIKTGILINLVKTTMM